MIPSQHRAGKVTALSRALVGVSVLALFMAVVEPAAAHPSGGPKYTDNHGSDTFYWPGASYNGHKIYLSPAHHWTGYKSGCDGYVEDIDMREIADQAAGVPATILNLEERGFYVRVGAGDPDDAVRRSNAWGSDRHIALHSNALGGCPSPTGGTIVFNYHGSGPGSFLAQELVDQLGPESPGDETDYRDPIPDPDVEDDMDLYELRETMMPAAYVETAFHDHNPDQNWLDSDEDFIAYLISLAVDDHLGYP